MTTKRRVGLGTNRLENTPANREFLRQAVDAGLEFIDTAHLYTSGESEATIGEALAPFPESLTVASKGAFSSGAGPDGLRRHVLESLERLRVDSIDLYYAHRLHPQYSVEAMITVLADYQAQGKIDRVGISGVTIEQIELAQTVTEIDSVQNEYNLGERSHDEVIDFCAENGITFVPYFPLRGGDEELVAEVAASHGATANQVKIAWLLRRSPAVLPIPGTLSIEHLRENLAATEIELSEEEYQRLATGR